MDDANHPTPTLTSPRLTSDLRAKVLVTVLRALHNLAIDSNQTKLTVIAASGVPRLVALLATAPQGSPYSPHAQKVLVALSKTSYPHQEDAFGGALAGSQVPPQLT